MFWALLIVALLWPANSAAPRLLLSRPKQPLPVRPYPVKELLNCEGANFSKSWRDFRLRATENAQAGFPKDDSLHQTASEIINQWMADAGRKSFTNTQVWLKVASVEELEDFCLYGYATALFIKFRHQPHVDLLLGIEGVLGWKLWPLDFMESSDWPLLRRGVSVHLAHALASGDASWSQTFQAWGSEERELILPTVDQVQRALNTWLSGMQPRRSTDLPYRDNTALQEGGTMKILVAGHHLGSSMEPYTMMREALKRLAPGMAVVAQFHGQRHPKPGIVCLEFGYCHANEALNAWFKQYESRFVGTYDWMPEKWPVAVEQLAAVIRADDFMSSSDCVVCGGPGWFCAMIRAVETKPMLLYFAWPLVPMVPDGTKAMLLWQMQAMARSSEPPTAIIAANWLLAAQFAMQLRVTVPVLRPHGLYVNQTYAPVPSPDGVARVLVSRLGVWSHTAGVALVELIWSFQRSMPHIGLPFELVFLSIRFRGVSPIFHVTYEEMAQFYACIFWPWDIMMLLFDELYTMTMPLLVPASSWMRSLMLHALQDTEMNWWHLRETVGGVLPSAHREGFPLPVLPWMAEGDGANSLQTVAFWFELTDFNQFPHVTRFHSIPDMLFKVQNLDVPSIRAGMRQFKARTLSRDLRFYCQIVRDLLR